LSEAALYQDLGASQGSILYFRDASSSATDTATLTGANWYWNNYLYMVNDDYVGSSLNSFKAVLSHEVITTDDGQAVLVAAPVFSIGQNDPLDVIPESELRAEFSVELVADGSGGYLFNVPGAVVLNYDVPLGSSGEIHLRVFFDDLTSNTSNILPYQHIDYVATPGTSDDLELSFDGHESVATIGANHRVRVHGYVQALVNNEGGPVSMELSPTLVPEPSAGLLATNAVVILLCYRRRMIAKQSARMAC
jgi:hypothetical protein